MALIPFKIYKEHFIEACEEVLCSIFGELGKEQKTVLKDISISYYYGAKIGVIGENGSGKSSLMKIFAGLDTEFTGEASILP